MLIRPAISSFSTRSSHLPASVAGSLPPRAPGRFTQILFYCCAIHTIHTAASNQCVIIVFCFSHMQRPAKKYRQQEEGHSQPGTFFSTSTCSWIHSDIPLSFPTSLAPTPSLPPPFQLNTKGPNTKPWWIPYKATLLLYLILSKTEQYVSPRPLSFIHVINYTLLYSVLTRCSKKQRAIKPMASM